MENSKKRFSIIVNLTTIVLVSKYRYYIDQKSCLNHKQNRLVDNNTTKIINIF